TAMWGAPGLTAGTAEEPQAGPGAGRAARGGVRRGAWRSAAPCRQPRPAGSSAAEDGLRGPRESPPRPPPRCLACASTCPVREDVAVRIAYTEQEEQLRAELRAYYEQLLDEDTRAKLALAEGIGPDMRRVVRQMGE